MLMAPRAATQPRVARPAPDEAPRRIGVLGGTFDPPHVGHLWLAALAADVLDLDRVLFMPAAQPPHKGGRLISKGTDRLLMTRLAIHTDPTFELSALEMERPGPSYTIDSVVELKRLYPDAELFLVMAADSLAQIDTWREPDRLLDEIEWAVGPRVGHAAAGSVGAGGSLRRSGVAHPPAHRSVARRQQLRGPATGGGRAHHPLPCAARGGGAHHRSKAVPAWLTKPLKRRPWRIVSRSLPKPPSWRIGSWRSRPTRRATTSSCCAPPS